MKHSLCTPKPRSAGFSLVELLVGIVVAMAAIIVVMQVFRISEGQRRSTSGGDDAQTSGAVALTLLQRDLRQAGQGFMSAQLLGCSLDLGNSRTLGTLAPIIINPTGIPAGDTNTDVLLVAYGSGWGAPEGGLIAIQPGPATYAVPASMSYRVGDRVIATPQTRTSPCSLNLTNISLEPTTTTVTVALGLANAANGVLYNLGRTPRFNVYAVRSGKLTVCDYLTQDCTSTDASNWTELAEGIVSLRAQYARDTTLPNRDAAADTFDQGTPTNWCGWGRVVGVRVAMVARGRQPEKTDVTSTAPTWSGSASTPIQLSGTDWKLYRYKTFDTTVPLRNTPLATDTNFLTCAP